jgi:hypothetical protein
MSFTEESRLILFWEMSLVLTTKRTTKVWGQNDVLLTSKQMYQSS